jgi:hypothetical protein
MVCIGESLVGGKGAKMQYSPPGGTSLLIILCVGDINEERNPWHDSAGINYSIINNLMTILSIREGITWGILALQDPPPSQQQLYVTMQQHMLLFSCVSALVSRRRRQHPALLRINLSKFTVLLN